MNCLENIIGLSQTTCECLIDGVPEDYNISKSGLYADQLEGLNIEMASGAEDCADGGIWDIMSKERDNAITDFTRDLLGCVGQKYQPKLKNFNYQLGQASFSGSLNNITSAVAGVRISTLQLRGGFFYLKRIGVIINQNAPVTLQVYSTLNNSEESTLLFQNSMTPLNAIVDTLTWATLSTPLELPMFDQNGSYIRYYVVMLLNGTFKPKANKTDCGCGGAKKPFAQYIDLSGVYGNGTNFQTFNSNGNYMNGLVLDTELKCKMSEIICSDQYPLDFENNADAMTTALAIQLRTGSRIYGKLLSSANINRFTMMNRDQISQYINNWNSQYQAAILSLCDNVNIDSTDCFICKTTNTSLIKQTILS